MLPHGFDEPKNPVALMNRRLSLLFLAACPLLIPACRQHEEMSHEEQAWKRPSGKTWLIHYMPWYETPELRGRWGSHWTGHEKQHQPDRLGVDGKPDIWSHYHPLIGLYDSTDVKVLECQLLQMKIAGIDGVIVDWYGIGKAADYPDIHQATRAMFDAAGRNSMTFSVCYEDRSVAYMEELKILKPEDVRVHLTETLQWMDKEWFRHDHYQRIGGRPLMLNFGPMHIKDPSVWSAALGSVPDRPMFFGLHHLWKNAGGDGGFMWVNQNVWDGSPHESSIGQRLQMEYDHASTDPAKLIVSAYPGFRDIYAKPHPVLEYRDGATMGESLRTCMKSPSEIVQFVTWNDYGEGTMIEPTHEFGYTFLEVIQDERKKELGSQFPFSKNDLRLPARLLELRRKGTASEKAAERIARLIIQGEPAAARAELDRIAPVSTQS